MGLLAQSLYGQDCRWKENPATVSWPCSSSENEVFKHKSASSFFRGKIKRPKKQPVQRRPTGASCLSLLAGVKTLAPHPVARCQNYACVLPVGGLGSPSGSVAACSALRHRGGASQ